MPAPVFISGLGIYTAPTSKSASSIIGAPAPRPVTIARDQSASAAISIQGWLGELETFAKNAHNYVVQAERAMQNANLAPSELAQSITTLQTSVHSYATQAQSRFDAIKDMAGTDPALASYVQRANAAQNGLTASVQRIDQLAMQAASAVSGEAATAEMLPPTSGFKFPMWGYVAAGVVFIGGALLLTGKKG